MSGCSENEMMGASMGNVKQWQAPAWSDGAKDELNAGWEITCSAIYVGEVDGLPSILVNHFKSLVGMLVVTQFPCHFILISS